MAALLLLGLCVILCNVSIIRAEDECNFQCQDEILIPDAECLPYDDIYSGAQTNQEDGIMRSLFELVQNGNDWLGKSGIMRRETLELEYAGGAKRVGVFAQAPIAVGMKVMTLPFSRLISSEAVLRNSWMRNIKFKSWPTNLSILTVFCIREYFDPESKYRAYFDLYPFDIDIPILWPESETNFLNPNPIYEDRRFLMEEFKLLDAEMFQNQRELFRRDVYTLDMYALFRTIVYSRSFGGFAFNPQDPMYLAPYVIDFINHSETPNAQLIWDTAKQMVTLQTTGYLFAGTELTIAYGGGKLTNLQLFIRYGFTVPNNTNSVVELRLNFEILKSSAKAEWMVTLLRTLPGVVPLPDRGDHNIYFSFKANLTRNSTLTQLQPLRVFSMDESDLTGEKVKQIVKAEKPISLKNELRTLNIVYSYISHLIQHQGTSIAHDTYLINHSSLKPRQKELLSIILEQKQLFASTRWRLKHFWFSTLYARNAADGLDDAFTQPFETHHIRFARPSDSDDQYPNYDKLKLSAPVTVDSDNGLSYMIDEAVSQHRTLFPQSFSRVDLQGMILQKWTILPVSMWEKAGTPVDTIDDMPKELGKKTEGETYQKMILEQNLVTEDVIRPILKI